MCLHASRPTAALPNRLHHRPSNCLFNGPASDITKSISKDYEVLIEEGDNAGVALRGCACFRLGRGASPDSAVPYPSSACLLPARFPAQPSCPPLCHPSVHPQPVHHRPRRPPAAEDGQRPTRGPQRCVPSICSCQAPVLSHLVHLLPVGLYGTAVHACCKPRPCSLTHDASRGSSLCCSRRDAPPAQGLPVHRHARRGEKGRRARGWKRPHAAPRRRGGAEQHAVVAAADRPASLTPTLPAPLPPALQVCPANWSGEGDATIKPNPKDSLEYFEMQG